MLTRIILHTAAGAYTLTHDDLKNWDDVECTYKRSGYDGIVRSFMSKFEFVNRAYDLVMAAYDSYGITARASVELQTIDDRWTYHKEFAADLDFATLSYTDHILSINAIDASIAAIIKANKSTKFEFTVGEDIESPKKYVFDRLEMIETATYSITEGNSNDDGSLTGAYSPGNNGRIYVGQLNKEIAVGGVLMLNEDQEYGDGCMFYARKRAALDISFSVDVDVEVGCHRMVLMKNDTELMEVTPYVKAYPRYLPGMTWRSTDQLKEYTKNFISDDDMFQRWVAIYDEVYMVERDIFNNQSWEPTGKTLDEWVSRANSGTITVQLKPGDRIWLKYDCDSDATFKVRSSEFKFAWHSRGVNEYIDVVYPEALIGGVLAKMGANGIRVEISDYDKRLAGVVLLSAESVRAIPNAKIYASFSDIANWMEAVFGYVYEIDEDSRTIAFMHRKEIFRDDAPIVEITDAVDFDFKIDKSVLYSSVTVGYPKKSYNSVNGRDEFNFSSYYSTHYKTGTKKLELKSPFRADSYGLEFLVEKRGESTSDTDSDQDVFFVTGYGKGSSLLTTYRYEIANSLTGTLINGEFAPVKCLFANADYISVMDSATSLEFASTDGNADIIIGGEYHMDGSYELENCDMVTAGELKFTSGKMFYAGEHNKIIRVKSRDYIYEGYIKEVSVKYACVESTEYTIMIKHKIPC